MQPDTPTPFGAIVEEGLRRGEAVIEEIGVETVTE